MAGGSKKDLFAILTEKRYNILEEREEILITTK
jgi:hypothetical protein